jgi:hypothetical protein
MRRLVIGISLCLALAGLGVFGYRAIERSPATERVAALPPALAAPNPYLALPPDQIIAHARGITTRMAAQNKSGKLTEAFPPEQVRQTREALLSIRHTSKFYSTAQELIARLDKEHKTDLPDLGRERCSSMSLSTRRGPLGPCRVFADSGGRYL